jgi:hypothetical protein
MAVGHGHYSLDFAIFFRPYKISHFLHILGPCPCYPFSIYQRPFALGLFLFRPVEKDGRIGHRCALLVIHRPSIH